MTTPAKPWESGGSNLRSDRNGSSLSLQSSSRPPDVNVRGNPAIPPPLPPRPSNVIPRRPLSTPVPQVYRSYPATGNYYGGYNSYGGAYNSYGSSYGNYGLYNGMGYGGGQYPVYPFNANDPSNRLVALAEESSRPAFENIEHVVRAFGSVSFMLESTLSALHALFRAALGVAEHLGQLRHILSAVSIFKLLQWIIRRVKVLFGVKGAEGPLGTYWGEATAKAVETPVINDRASPVPSHWLLGAFLGFVMSGSYLAWRLVSHIVGPGNDGKLSPFRCEEGELWVQSKDPNCIFAVGGHDFTATTDQELSFRAGQKLVIAPKSRQPYDLKDWLLAAHVSCSKTGGQPKIGLIPENYIRLLDRRSSRVNVTYPPPGNVAYQSANYSYSPYGTYTQGYQQTPQNSQQSFMHSQMCPQQSQPPTQYPQQPVQQSLQHPAQYPQQPLQYSQQNPAQYPQQHVQNPQQNPRNVYQFSAQPVDPSLRAANCPHAKTHQASASSKIKLHKTEASISTEQAEVMKEGSERVTEELPPSQSGVVVQKEGLEKVNEELPQSPTEVISNNESEVKP